MTLDDDNLLAVYNQELIALSSAANMPRRLSSPTVSTRAVSPICGSEVEIDLVIEAGEVKSFGFAIEACALTKAVVSVMAHAIVGKTKSDIQEAATEMKAMLSGAGAGPSGDWERLRILAPVKDYKARHNAIMLPFEAVEKAFHAKR